MAAPEPDWDDNEDFGLSNQEPPQPAEADRALSERAESVDLYGDVAGVCSCVQRASKVSVCLLPALGLVVRPVAAIASVSHAFEEHALRMRSSL